MRLAILSGVVVAVLAGLGAFLWTATPSVQNIEMTDSTEELQRLEDFESSLRKLSESFSERIRGIQVIPPAKPPAALICADARLWTGDTRSTCYVPPKICQGGTAECARTASIWLNQMEM